MEEGNTKLNVGVPTPPTFTCFPRLPAELRLKIWKLNLPGPRLVVITVLRQNKHKLHELRSRSSIPVNLHVNQESRIEAQKEYKPRFAAVPSQSGTSSGPVSPPAVYFSSELDTAVFTYAKFHWDSGPDPKKFFSCLRDEDRNSIQSMMMIIHPGQIGQSGFSTNPKHFYGGRFDLLPSLKNIWLLLAEMPNQGYCPYCWQAKEVKVKLEAERVIQLDVGDRDVGQYRFPEYDVFCYEHNLTDWDDTARTMQVYLNQGLLTLETHLRSIATAASPTRSPPVVNLARMEDNQQLSSVGNLCWY